MSNLWYKDNQGDSMNTDKYIEGNLYINSDRRNKYPTRFASEELPPFQRDGPIRVRAHFEIIPEKSGVFQGVSDISGAFIWSEGEQDRFFEWINNWRGKKVEMEMRVIEDETRK
jgi:hypothetical protein